LVASNPVEISTSTNNHKPCLGKRPSELIENSHESPIQSENDDEPSAQHHPQSRRKTTRTSERTIEEIIDKVTMWRKLYNGAISVEIVDGKLVQSNKRLRKCSLIDAARKIGMSKKSLDDYLLQLRFGRKFGFDFDGFRNEKVGVLRAFVKQKKGELRQMSGSNKISSKVQLDSESNGVEAYTGTLGKELFESLIN
jgi:hypothetical protein